MRDSRRSRATTGFIALVAVGGIALFGCTNNEEPSEPEPTTTSEAQAPEVEGSEPSQSPPPSQGVSDGGGEPPQALEIEDETVQETAEQYLTERENQASHYRDEPNDWLATVKEYMTEEGYARLTEDVSGGSGGYAWGISHDQGLAVKVEVGQCEELTQTGADTDTEKTISCSVNDVVVDKDGKRIPTTEIPPTWPYVGQQQNALLEMKKSGEGWKVDMDMTGMAN